MFHLLPPGQGRPGGHLAGTRDEDLVAHLQGGLGGLHRCEHDPERQLALLVADAAAGIADRLADPVETRSGVALISNDGK